MGVNTYDELDVVTVATATPSITFSSIPQTYTDLIIVASGAAAGGALEIQVGNGTVDTTSSYSRTYCYGDGSVAPSFRNTNLDRTYNTFGLANRGDSTFHFMNYSNTSVFKSIISRGNDAVTFTTLTLSTWRQSNSINIIRMTGVSGGNIAAGSTFSLYGVRAWANTETSPKATGGYVYQDASYWYHAFPFSSTFTPNQSLTADVLTVGGGASGIYGNYAGPGGGGGEAKYSASQSLSATAYTVTVGAGGAATTGGAAWSPGVTTTFASINALGAGQSPYTSAGQSGTGFNSNGGAGGSTATEYSGGGGGSTANGTASAGGAGLTTSVSGVSNSYGGGGGGGLGTNYTVGSLGRGTDGGGNGASNDGPGTSGVSGRGGGGGGGTVFRGGTAGSAGNGGSGIVIVRYAK
jgi:hypothetical protein